MDSSVKMDAAERDTGAPPHRRDAAQVADANTDAAQPTDAGTDSAVPLSLPTPLIDVVQSILPDSGPVGVHLGWTTYGVACDSIEIQHSDALYPWSTIATVPGTVSTYDDLSSEQRPGHNWTYRLRCKKGSAVSDWSPTEFGSAYP